MLNRFKKHIYKIIYILMLIASLVSLIRFEYGVKQDRKCAKEDITHTETLKICSIPKYSNDAVYFTAKPAPKSNLKSMVSVKIDKAHSLKLHMGDTLKLRGRYEIPDGALNPGGYDYGSYLKSIGSSLVLNSAIHEVLYHKKGHFTYIYDLRTEISKRINNNISSFTSGIINALVTGNKDNMSAELKNSFKSAGVYHVVAVSGLHLNLLVMFLSFFYINLRMNRKVKTAVSCVVTISACLFMLIFTGFGISVERAAFMAVLLCASSLVSREYSPFVGLYLIFVFVLITEPYSWRNMSFCLSFSATAGVLLGAELINKYKIAERKYSALWQSIIISQCANLATLPFTVYYFRGISLISALSNLVILMLIPLLLGLSYIFALVCIWAPVFIVKLAGGMVSATAAAVNCLVLWFSALPYSYVPISNYTALLIAGGGGIIVALWKLRNTKLKFLISVIILVANISFLTYNISVDKVTVTFLNSSQGECSLIKDSDGTVIMIDCGSESRTGFGTNEVIPYLGKQGIFKIDALFVTHYHADHANGLTDLLDAGYIGTLILPDRVPQDDEQELASQIYRSAVKNNVKILHVSKGDTILCGNSHRFDILSPYAHSEASANNLSLVIDYTYQSKHILYTGDIENEMLYMLNKTLADYDIIKIPHHGAKASQLRKTVKITKPEYAVISCGKQNKYNHPDKTTLDTFSNCEILRTDICGGPISFEIRNDEIRKKENTCYE